MYTDFIGTSVEFGANRIFVSNLIISISVLTFASTFHDTTRHDNITTV